MRMSCGKLFLSKDSPMGLRIVLSTNLWRCWSRIKLDFFFFFDRKGRNILTKEKTIQAKPGWLPLTRPPQIQPPTEEKIKRKQKNKREEKLIYNAYKGTLHEKTACTGASSAKPTVGQPLVLLQQRDSPLKDNLRRSLDCFELETISHIPNGPSHHCPSVKLLPAQLLHQCPSQAKEIKS